MSYTLHTSAEWHAIAARAPRPASVYRNLWHEGECACILADDPDECSVAALRVAESVAESRPVLFVDLRGSLRSYVARSGAPCSGKLMRVEIDRPAVEAPTPEAVLADIEAAVVESRALVCVIDSLSWLCDCFGKSDSARIFMREISEMRRRLGISVLVAATSRRRLGGGAPTVAHLPLRTGPFFDAVFAGAQVADETETVPALEAAPVPASAETQKPAEGDSAGASAHSAPLRPLSRAERRREARKIKKQPRFLPESGSPAIRWL